MASSFNFLVSSHNIQTLLDPSNRWSKTRPNLFAVSGSHTTDILDIVHSSSGTAEMSGEGSECALLRRLSADQGSSVVSNDQPAPLRRIGSVEWLSGSTTCITSYASELMLVAL